MIEIELHCVCGTANTQRLYGPAEATSYLGVSEQTLNRWRRQGWIRCSQVGRGYYYQASDMDDALTRQNYDRANYETEVILR